MSFPYMIPMHVHLGINSIDINLGLKMGPKIGPRCIIENWPIGWPWQAFTHWQNWPENGPENWPEIFYVNWIDPQGSPDIMTPKNMTIALYGSFLFTKKDLQKIISWYNNQFVWHFCQSPWVSYYLGNPVLVIISTYLCQCGNNKKIIARHCFTISCQLQVVTLSQYLNLLFRARLKPTYADEMWVPAEIWRCRRAAYASDLLHQSGACYIK